VAPVPFYLQQEEVEKGRIVRLNPKKTTEKLIKVKGEKMTVKLKRTSEEDYKLYTRLVAIKDRAILELISIDDIGLTGGSTKTVNLLKFVVGKYKNKIESNFKIKQVFLDVYDAADPLDVAKIITIDKGKTKIVEIRWIVDPFTITEEWDRDFDLCSKPEIQEPPRKKPKWETMGISKEEFNKRKARSSLDEMQEQNPDQFDALLVLIESGNLVKLMKLADTL
jgi:hypothetical protein